MESKGVQIIAQERQRHLTEEGWTPERDAEYNQSELALAAACYALPAEIRVHHMLTNVPIDWPWDQIWWKPTPKDRIKELRKAGALIAAEIDRLLAKDETNGN